MTSALSLPASTLIEPGDWVVRRDENFVQCLLIDKVRGSQIGYAVEGATCWVTRRDVVFVTRDRRAAEMVLGELQSSLRSRDAQVAGANARREHRDATCLAALRSYAKPQPQLYTAEPVAP